MESIKARLKKAKAEADKAAKLVQTLIALSKPRTLSIPAVDLTFQPGEIFLGMVSTEDGFPAYYLILAGISDVHLRFEDAVSWLHQNDAQFPSIADMRAVFAIERGGYNSDVYYWVKDAGAEAEDEVDNNDDFEAHTFCPYENISQTCDKDEESTYMALGVRRVYVTP